MDYLMLTVFSSLDHARIEPAIVNNSSDIGVKNEHVTAEPSSEVEASSSSAAAPQQSLQTERIQKLMAEASPEVLEAEVLRNQDFLEKIKRPMAEHVAQQQDAKYFVQQIGRLAVEVPSRCLN